MSIAAKVGRVSDRADVSRPAPHRDNAPPGLSILIVDDSRLYREGLSGIILKEPDIEAVYTAEDGASLTSVLGTVHPRLVLVNLASVDGLALLRAVRAAVPTSSLIAIGVLEYEDEIIACVEAGIAGYLLRSEPLSNLMRLIRSVTAGETVCSPRITAALMRRVSILAAERRSTTPVLTEREDQIVQLLDRGLSNREIADALGIELRTVKNHVHHILTKLGVRRRGEAAAAARVTRCECLATSHLRPPGGVVALTSTRNTPPRA